MKITDIKSLGDGYKFNVFVDGNCIENIDYDFVITFDLKIDEEADSDVLAMLFNYEEFSNAVKRAYNILSFRSHGEKELIKKLMSKNIERQAAEYAAFYMIKKGYINDENYAQELLEYYTGKGFGKGRIRSEMLKKGISGSIINDVLEDFQNDSSRITEILEKRYKKEELSDPKIKNRAISYLLRQGYSYDEIFSRIRAYTEDYDETY
ncbi:MAG: regulatory protein RecX [Clostridia bacterium]|nr:regulatory protein RecX [Clostridia bacterium]